MNQAERNKLILSVMADFIGGRVTDDEFILRCHDVIREYNSTLPTRLAYEPCDCIARNHAALPGQVGRLYAVVKGEYYFIRNCEYCGK